MSVWKTAVLLFSGFGLYSVANASAGVATTRERKKKIFRGQAFWVMAHRGYSGRYPENTMLAFEEAAKFPIDAIELDVHASRDGRIVVMHDPTLERTTDGKGRISDFSWEELKKLDAGYNFDPGQKETYPFRGKGIRIPLLEEVFKRFPDMRFVIEIKQVLSPVEGSLYRLIRKYRMEEKVIVASEYHEPLAEFRTIAPYVATSFSGVEANEFYQRYRLRLSNFFETSGDALQIPPVHHGKTIVTKGFVRAVLRKGLVIHVWTVNDPAEMARLIECGVNGIITDFPDVLVEVANSLKGVAEKKWI